MNLLHMTTSLLFTSGLGVRMVSDNQKELQSGSSAGPLVDISRLITEDEGKAVTVDGTKYRCCCRRVEDDGIAVTAGLRLYHGVSCLLANTSEEKASGLMSFMKSGCGALLGSGYHSYMSKHLPEESRMCLVPVDLLPPKPESFCQEMGYGIGADPLYGCRFCLPNYDRSCRECLEGYDPTTACKKCLPGRDPGLSCRQCFDDHLWVRVTDACLPESQIIDLTREFTDTDGLNPKKSVTYKRLEFDDDNEEVKITDLDVSYRCCCASGRRRSNGEWLDDDGVSCRLVDESKKTMVGMMLSGCGSLQDLSDGTYHSWTSKKLPRENARACKVPLGELPDEVRYSSNSF